MPSHSNPRKLIAIGFVFVVLPLVLWLWNLWTDNPISLYSWGTLTGGIIVVLVGLWLDRRHDKTKHPA
jgi:peptidoglycan biosynthesis protein MviN/MurJ (putative lipid II flippase)